MDYKSPAFGKVKWPWYHDLLICGGFLFVLGLVAGFKNLGPWPWIFLVGFLIFSNTVGKDKSGS